MYHASGITSYSRLAARETQESSKTAQVCSQKVERDVFISSSGIASTHGARCLHQLLDVVRVPAPHFTLVERGAESIIAEPLPSLSRAELGQWPQCQ